MTRDEFNNLLTSNCVVSKEVYLKILAMREWYNIMPPFVDQQLNDRFFETINDLNKSFLPTSFKEAIDEFWMVFVEWKLVRDSVQLVCSKGNVDVTFNVEVEK